jgi:hypothetical protein
MRGEALMLHRRWRAALALLVFLPLAGCGEAKSSITGKVTFQGKPLQGCRVVFMPAKGQQVSVDVGENGLYTAEGVAVGEARVVVSIPRKVSQNPFMGMQDRGGPPISPEVGKPKFKPDGSPADAARGGAGAPAARSSPMPTPAVEVPDEVIRKFGDPATSGLKVQVEKGETTFNIEVK